MIFYPRITPSSNLVYSPGMTGNKIAWSISAANNVTSKAYTIYRNAAIIGTGNWATNVPISLHVDGLPLGNYNYTISIPDGLGGKTQNTIVVSVVPDVPPAISRPPDITYDQGAIPRLNLTWTITDTSTGNDTECLLYKNGTPGLGLWWMSGVPVTFYLGNLDAGIYNFTVVANDGIGGTSQDTVIVTVKPNTIPASTWAIVISMGAVIASVAIVGIHAKKQRQHELRRAIAPP